MHLKDVHRCIDSLYVCMREHLMRPAVGSAGIFLEICISPYNCDWPG